MEMILDHRRMRGLVAISIMLILAACSPTPDRSSPIVQKAKDAGAGDLTTASAPSIEDWLRKHRDLAVELDGMCKPARQKGDAKWLDTTEGRLCTAAQNAAMYAPNKPKKKSDGQTFEPGWK
jgi:hypothetical protein